MELTTAVPWGRNLAEYRAMFRLSQEEAAGRILDCAGGPSSFNAEMTGQGSVVSCDPLYAFGVDEISARIEAVRPEILESAEAARERFVWTSIASVAELEKVRTAAMRRFLDDFPVGKAEGRYVEGALPALPFTDSAFDLALCGHFLFTYSAAYSTDFHLASLVELCRVAREARVFPLLDRSGGGSPHLAPVVQRLRGMGYAAEVRPVPYEFQRGGNQMLCVRSDTV